MQNTLSPTAINYNVYNLTDGPTTTSAGGSICERNSTIRIECENTPSTFSDAARGLSVKSIEGEKMYSRLLNSIIQLWKRLLGPQMFHATAQPQPRHCSTTTRLLFNAVMRYEGFLRRHNVSEFRTQ